jgi:hypothetical protein
MPSGSLACRWSCSSLFKKKRPGTGFVHLTLPIPGFVSVVGLAGFRLSGDGVQFVPGLPLCLIQLPLFLLGKLLVGNKFFHK